MNLLIIGASGFVGSNLMETAREKGIRVVGTSSKVQSNSYECFDIQKDNIMDIIKRHDLKPSDTKVAICAAISKIDQCFMNKDLSYNINVISTKRVMDSLYCEHFRFCFISSDAVFDGDKGYYTESSTCNPNTEYGKQKAEIESYITKNMPENLILRIGIVIDNRNRKGNPLKEFYEKTIIKEPIYCMKDRLFCPVYVKDLSEIMIIAFQKDLKGLYNIGVQEIFSRLEFAQLFVKLSEDKTEVIEKEMEWFGFKDARFKKTCLVSEKIRNELVYEMASVKNIIKSFLKNIEMHKDIY